ncbi:predicted protein [Thalassiosira pseudonana CCMP1335]|uniref:Uncharacterized protein n=1 Tax=Thalassiosira pseudonana TaxID=35128 RepID=B8C8Z9_THAPS|nr:predicted protein [Thalassiosira pseudonana CCMP1335]EED89764.1 predicted protein [Thalassiosira pseudonana CCMP1335]
MAMASYSEDIQEFLRRDRERISSFNDGSGTIVEDGSPIFRRSRDVSTFNCDNDNKRRMYDEDSGSSLRKAELNGEGNTEAFTGLALDNNLQDGESDNVFNIPYQVKEGVKIAQYAAIIIALVMEEELPTGFYLLRMITKKSLHEKYPRIMYYKFIFSALVRIGMGYLFLFNTFLVVIQATGVLEIFYDVLALDDIAFRLATIDVFGKRMKKATSAKVYRTEFERQPFAFRRNMSRFLATLYFFNFCIMFLGMGYFTVKQNRGDYYCDSISVNLGDAIWEDAVVLMPTGEIHRKVLIFAYFNGMYVMNENKRIATFMGSALAGVAFVTKLGFILFSRENPPTGSNSTFNLVEWDDEEFFRIYGRPVYRYQTGFSDELLASQNVTEQEDAIFLLYTGNRWFGTVYKGVRNNTREYWDAYTREFHSFWEDAYAEVTRFVSDPTTGSSPIAVDFFLIGQRGEEFGPFGELFPLREPGK